MSKTVTLRLDDESYRVLRAAAEAEGRSLANLIQRAAMLRVQEDQFMDEAEMAEILANENLMARLQKGSRDARNRRGRFAR